MVLSPKIMTNELHNSVPQGLWSEEVEAEYAKRKQFQGREGKQNPPEIQHRSKFELFIFSEVTAIDVKKTTRKPELTKFIDNLYFILVAVVGKQSPYIKFEIVYKIVRMFENIDRLWSSIERDRRRNFLN